MQIFCYLKEVCKDGERFFARACDKTKGNSLKVKEERLLLHMRKKCFVVKMVRHWKRLPRVVVDAPSLAVFKTSWMGFETTGQGKCPCLRQEDCIM